VDVKEHKHQCVRCGRRSEGDELTCGVVQPSGVVCQGRMIPMRYVAVVAAAFSVRQWGDGEIARMYEALHQFEAHPDEQSRADPRGVTIIPVRRP